MPYSLPAKIGNKYINLDVLKTDEERSRGYQHGFEPNDEEGLLFLFNSERPRRFHMRNVPFDLDLLGFNGDGRLIFTMRMKANSEEIYKTLPCKYVVETRGGWSADLPVGGCHLNVENFPLTEASVVNFIAPRLSTHATDNDSVGEDNSDSPAVFNQNNWLDLDKDGVIDTYNVFWDKFNPVDMKKNAPYFVKKGAKNKK